MKLPEINKKVDSVIKKFNDWETKNGEIELFIDGEMKSFPVKRRYMDRFATLCIPSKCDAEGNCCHYSEVDGIGLCFYAASTYDILYKNSVILDHLTADEERELFEKINYLLKELESRK